MNVTILDNLSKALMEYDSDGTRFWAKKVIEEKLDPVLALDALTEAIRRVGDGFAKNELWLPDLVGAAKAMQAAIPILEEEMKRTRAERESLGVVVIGTVFGDIHDIGKSMVSTLLLAEGFRVHDLGINVRAEEFLKAVKEFRPSILAMSALLTTTAPEQKKVIELLIQEGRRKDVKVMVGGGSITADFAMKIGADGYDPTAVGAAKMARRFVAK